MIKIEFRDGDEIYYQESEYTDYAYDKRCFIVIWQKQWIGIYNIDAVKYISVGSEADGRNK